MRYEVNDQVRIVQLLLKLLMVLGFVAVYAATNKAATTIASDIAEYVRARSNENNNFLFLKLMFIIE